MKYYALLPLLVSNIISQAQTEKKFTYGAFGGVTISKLKGAQGHAINTNKDFVNATGGLMVAYKLTENFAALSGVSYVRLSGSETYYDFYLKQALTGRYKEDFLIVPLTLRALTSPSKIRGYAEISYSSGFKIGTAKFIGEANGWELTHAKFYRSGIAFGGGAILKTSAKFGITAGYTYNLGLTSIVEDDSESFNFSTVHLGICF